MLVDKTVAAVELQHFADLHIIAVIKLEKVHVLQQENYVSEQIMD